MAEPTRVQVPAEDEVEAETQPHPTAGVDRQAAAALSRLDQQHNDDDQSHQNVDKEALGKAMKGLGDVSDTKVGKKDQKQAPAKKIKLDPKEVEFIVEWCYVGKKKAEQMLREAEGDGDKAISDWVAGSKAHVVEVKT